MSPAATLWSIPPIQDAIASQLLQKDLCHCIRVCKEWNECFIPFVWRNVKLGTWTSNIRFKAETTPVSKYLHYIKRLETFEGFSNGIPDVILDRPRVLPSCPPTTTLVHLETSIRGSSSNYQERVIRLVDAQPLLRSLVIQGLAIEEKTFKDLYEVLVNHPSLVELELLVGGTINRAQLTSLLQGAHRLRRLSVEMDFDYEEDLQKVPVALSTFQDCLLEEFKLYPPSPRLNPVVHRFLEHCPKLKRISTWWGSERENEIKAFWGMVRDCCPDFEDMFLQYDDMYPGNKAAGMLMAFTGLKRIHLPMVEQSARVLNAVRWNHASRLVELDPGIITIDDLIPIVQACSQLKTLRVKVEWNFGMSSIEHQPKLDAGPWACQDLEKLDLSLSMDHIPEQDLKAMVDLLFEKIGLLIRMTEFRIEHRGRGWALANSFSARIEGLAGLKKLINFEYWDWKLKTVKEEDLLRMLDQWPRVVELSFACYPIGLEFESSFREKVRARRPWLCVGHDRVMETGRKNILETGWGNPFAGFRGFHGSMQITGLE